MADLTTRPETIAGLPDSDSLESVHHLLDAHRSRLPGRWLPILLWTLACGGLIVAVRINLWSAQRPPVKVAVEQPAAPIASVATTEVPPNDVAEIPEARELLHPRFQENPYEQDGVATSALQIDLLVEQRLEALGIAPANLCSDAVFLRRAYLDVIGTLPTPEEAVEFLDSNDPHKRRHLIDELLDRPEFADYWAMKWCDVLRVKAEFPINLWPNAAQAYHRWIRTALQSNRPYDEFARELLTSSGSNFRTPQVNFYRALQGRDPEDLASVVALTFLGERFDQWPALKQQQMAVFFAQIGFKPTGEWKEEIVIFDPRRVPPDSDEKVLQTAFPDGNAVTLPEGADPRIVFADWLIDGGNPHFVRPAVNRVWYWLLGHGIVEPADDFRPDNPPTNPALLDYLAQEFVAADYDQRELIRLILNTNTYQRSCVAVHSDSEQSSAEFASCDVRRLDAEVLIDAICQVTGTTEMYSSMIPEPFTFLPDNQRAIALPDGSITSSFLEMFGRPARDTGMLSERNNRLTARQALHLLNSNHIRQKIQSGPGLQALLDAGFGMSASVDNIYLAVLSRRPTLEEREALNYLQLQEHGYRTFVWSLINSDEFLFRH